MVKRFPKQYLWVTAIQSVTTLIACVVPIAVYLVYLGGLSTNSAIIGAVALAAIAVPTGQSSLALVINEFKLNRGRLTDLLSYIAGIDVAFGLIVFGLLFCCSRALSVADLNPSASAIYMAVSMGMGVVTGWMLHLVTRVRCTQEELLLFTIGIVVFSTGLAVYLGISPLFVTATAGFVIANTKGAKVRIFRVLSSLEKPFYIIILLIGGALIDVASNWQGTLLLAIIYVVLRMSGKLAGGYLSAALIHKPKRIPTTLGLGLASQGGTSAAMALSFYSAFGGRDANVILFATFSAIIFFELISPALVRRLIEREA